MGLSAAWELSRKGYPVSVFERSFFGSGASGVPYAALWPSAATKKGRGHQLHRQSLWEFERFIHQLSDAAEMPIEFARLGRVELFTSAERRRASVKETEVASAEWPSFSSEPAQRIADADEIRRLEPEVEATEWGGLVCQATAYVNTKDLLASLRSALLRNGGSLHEHCNVQDIWIDQGRARGIVADRPIPGSNVLVTAGAWTSLLCPELAKAAPVTPVKGQVILLRPRTPLFKRLLKRGKTYLIPTASGDVLVGSTSEPEAGFDEQPTLSAREQLVEAACEIVPALRDAMFVEQWVGLRPQTDSRSPHVGPVPNVASLFVAAGHFKIGIAMAPVVGNLTRQMLDPTAESST
jgi:glycine oxidase